MQADNIDPTLTYPKHRNRLKNHIGNVIPIQHYAATVLLFLFIVLISTNVTNAQTYKLIAHRGGVVDSLHTENSLPALEAAVKQEYWMTEIDLRQTKDGVFILQHERTLKNFGIDKPVTDMTWNEINLLKNRQGSKVITLNDALLICRGKMQVMIDNKIAGNDTVMFSKVVAMLKKYDLLTQALMIGTDESTEYFTGKIKLSCTIQQLQDNKQKHGFKAGDYYLFGGTDSMTAEDVAWANNEGIMVVGVVNRFRYLDSKNPSEAIAFDIKTLKSWGVKNFQLDSEFSKYFGK
ncbi:MAG: glycerophosphodiester phosphodiesterase family protein [Chryseolinea sp.]